jgi:hypothetical protein
LAAPSGHCAGRLLTSQAPVRQQIRHVAGTSRIQIGMTHAGKTITVIPDSNSFRVVIDGETAVIVPRTTSTEIDRYKAHATRTRKQ